MDVNVTDFAALHDRAFLDDTFLGDIEASQGTQADAELWRWVDGLVGNGAVLEIGPGSGHLLAAARAAGREVHGIESSEVHRAYIRRTWGIEELYASVEGLPPDKQFGGIVCINTIEHVYDIVGILAALREHLLPDGKVLISTCSAACAVLPLVGIYWSMFKPVDHVSIGSPKGMELAALRANLVPLKTWTTEMPLETPVGLMVAARDFAREEVLPRLRGAPRNEPRVVAATHGPPVRRDPLSRKAKRLLMNAAAGFDLSSRLASRLGRAATVKVLLGRR